MSQRKIGGHVSIAGNLLNSITSTQKIGGNCLQIFAGSPRVWSRKPFDSNIASEFVNQTNSLDLNPVFIHALYLVNLAAVNQNLINQSVDSIIADMNNGQLIHAAGVIVHIGSHQGRGFDSVKTDLVKIIKSILDQTSIVPLVLENDAGQNGKIGSIEELAFIFENISSPRLKICLDTAHLFETGYDLRRKESVDHLVDELTSHNLQDKLICIHLNDSRTPLDSHRDMHANLGEGEIGLEGLGYFVNHPKLNHLPLILEVPGADKTGPDKKNIDIAKSLTRI
jgi:deoxyribonuclease IV